MTDSHSGELLLTDLWHSSEEFVGSSGVPYATKVWHERGGSSASAVQFCRRWSESTNPVPLNLQAVITCPDPRDWINADETEDATPPSAATDVYSLSEPQIGVLMATEMSPGDQSAYGFYAVFECDDQLVEEALRNRYAALLRAHVALTIRIVDTLEGPKQQTRDIGSLAAEGFGVHRTPTWKSREDLVRRFGRTQFDIRRDPLFAWDLVISDDGRSALVHSEHHLVHDGRSFERVVEELALLEQGQDLQPEGRALRDATKSSQAADDPELPSKGWGDLTTGHQLAGKRPWGASEQAPFLRLPISQGVRSQMAALAGENGLSEFEMWFAVFTQAALKVLNVDRAVAAVSIAGRSAKDYDSVGMYVRMAYLPLASEEATEAELMRSARAVRDRLELPLATIQEMARAYGRADASDASLAAVSFNTHVQQRRHVELCGKTTHLTMGVHIGGAKFPINGILIQHEETGDAELLLEGQPTVVSAEDLWTVWSLASRTWRRLLGLEREDVGRRNPVTRLESRIKDFAVAHGDWVALENETTSITYGELEDCAQRMSAEVQPGDHVMVVAEGSPAHYALAYAVMSCGGWYVPVDPQKGDDYVRGVVDSLQPSFVVTDPEGVLNAHRCGSGSSLVRLRREPETGDVLTGGYIIYTSGTTKEPRGVRVPKAHLSSHCPESSLVRRIKPRHRVSQVASPGFDASGYEVWPALFAGATVCFVPAALRYDIRELGRFFQEKRIDHAFLPTPLGELFLAVADKAELISLSVGGDRLHDHERPLAFPLINAYGPTENVIACSLRRIESGEKIDGTIAHCLSVHTETVLPTSGDLSERRVGEGELWIGGAQASEYVGNELETARKFVPLPGSDDLALMHRTGDLVSLVEGGMRVVGRVDRQVKLAGNRINLDSVEATLTTGVAWIEAAHVEIDPKTERAVISVVGVPPSPQGWRSDLDVLLPAAMRGSRLILAERNFNLSGKREWKGSTVGQPDDKKENLERERLHERDNFLMSLVTALPEDQQSALREAAWAEIKRRVLG